MHIKDNILFLWEDDDDLIVMFSLFLKEHGYFMKSLKSFDECIGFCENKPPAILIMHRFIDHTNNSLDFIRKLRLHPNISYFPIIVGWADFTRDNKEQGYREAFEAGANACFGSVFDTTDVLEQIRLLLNNPMITGLADRQ